MTESFEMSDSDGTRNEFRKLFSKGMAAYEGDREQGGKRITLFEHFDSMGIKFTPVSDHERMKLVREESYRQLLQQVTERSKWNAGREFTESDIKEYRRLWLIDELKRIRDWQEENPQDRPENLIELKKYESYINNELWILTIPVQWEPLPNLNEYLLRLNRLLVELPNKLARLFPRLQLIPSKYWDESARLEPTEYLAVVHRYGQSGLSNDANMLQNIRLDPDFRYYLKDRDTDPKRIKEQLDNIQSAVRYLKMCQVYTSDFDMNTVDESKVGLWNVINGITELLDWLVSLTQLLQSCLPEQPPLNSIAMTADTLTTDSVFPTTDYRENNTWLKNRLRLALIGADDVIVEKWMSSFNSDLKAEPDRAETVFQKYRDHYLAQRQHYIHYNNLYTEFFEKQGGFSEPMLQALTNRVQTMYLNSSHELIPEDLVQQVYAINFMITRLNAWKVKSTLTTLPPAVSQSKQPGFDTYVIEEHRTTLMPYLIENYTNASPEKYGYMLYALVSLRCVPNSTLNSNQSALHRALNNTFGNIGTRQALNTAIRRLDKQEINDEDKRNVSSHTERIRKIISPKTAD